MKNYVHTFIAIGFVFGLVSCRDTPADNSQEEVDILETPEETTIEEVQEDRDTIVVDSVQTDTVSQEETDSLSGEQ